MMRNSDMLTRRQLEMVEMRRDGATYPQIADHYGISRQWANQVVRTWERRYHVRLPRPPRPPVHRVTPPTFAEQRDAGLLLCCCSPPRTPSAVLPAECIRCRRRIHRRYDP